MIATAPVLMRELLQMSVSTNSEKTARPRPCHSAGCCFLVRSTPHATRATVTSAVTSPNAREPNCMITGMLNAVISPRSTRRRSP